MKKNELARRTGVQKQSDSVSIAAGEGSNGSGARKIGVSASTLERWHADALRELDSMPC